VAIFREALMCGIAGAITYDDPGAMRTLVESIVASQVFRGPDYQGIEVVTGRRSRVVLGHNRLAIIDLSAAANQPMWDRSRRLCIVFNGEIYNYVEIRQELASREHEFRTRSDTEVILEAFRAWGIDAVARFNGMFAFAIYDAIDERLFVVRDRFGVKPLYYHVGNDGLAFASTGAAIADWSGLKPDLAYAARGLRWGVYESEDLSPYVEMKALRPGHYMEASFSSEGRLTAEVKRYYDLGEQVAAMADGLAAKPVADLVARVDELLGSAVDLRFRSDVPVAVSLSGGLDSSSVAAAARRRDCGEIIGFTFGHPRASESEGPVTQTLVDHAGIKVHYVWPGIDEIVASYLETIQAQDAPFTSASVMAQYLLYKEVKSAGIRVLLGGQGGDESFMGYRKFQVFHLRELLGRRRYIDACTFATRLFLPVLVELTNMRSYLIEIRRYIGWVGDRSLLKLPLADEVFLGSDPREPLWKRQVSDIALASLPTLLRFEDRNSMAHSVESRLPFLDYRLVELALALPTAVKLCNGYGKWVLREAVRGGIPEAIRSARYKRGFDVQQGQWISRGLGASIREALHARSQQIKQWLPAGAAVDKVFSDNQLKWRKTAFSEATSLIWMADRSESARTKPRIGRGNMPEEMGAEHLLDGAGDRTKQKEPGFCGS